jgi:hypothetical protein
MKLAKIALLTTLLILTSVFAVSAQTLRPESDWRNTAPTVGTGGAVGGPTGLFTVYDGQTLRKGEYTFSAALSNFDRDPGNVDFTEVPVSFQVGLSDHIELFFNTDAYRAVKVNSPANLSGFYLPNSQLRVGAGFASPAAVVLAPQGAGVSQFPNTAIFRPQGAPFAQFPYSGASAGAYGYTISNPGTIFGFASGVAQLGPPRAGGNGADLFPGVGSAYGGILPGLVLQINPANTAPEVYTVAPSYLPDAPFLNRQYGETAFSTYTAGAKWRWTGPNNPLGVGVIAYYNWVNDTANTPSGFNQLQRGASAGGNRGDVGATMFADARVRKWMNISANIGYKYTSQVKGEFPNGTFVLLDRPDEVSAAIGLDFPVNRYFQPILEFRTLQYVGGRTPNAFENSPTDALAGFRWFPTRWISVGAAYRYNVNQQDRDSLKDSTFNGNVIINGRITPATTQIVSGGVPNGFRTSNDPHGYIAQFTIGRRNSRSTEGPGTIKPFADVTDLEVEDSMVTLPCANGTDGCSDKSTLSVKSTATSSDPTDTLLYNYTVSGGRIVGNGSNVSWDLSGAKAGTYTITSAVDNGCGLCGKTQTKTVTVKECTDCEPKCSCPTLSVSGPTSVKEKEMMTFTANASGVDKYNWTVSAGTIKEGQGTSVITVDTSDVACGTSVTATAEMMSDNNICKDCRTTSSATSDIECPPVQQPAKKVNEQGPAVDDDVKNSLQNIRDGELGSDPTAMLYIINTGSKAAKAKRVKQLNKAIDFLPMDRSRITIVDGGTSGRALTEYWIVPAGAQPPM